LRKQRLAIILTVTAILVISITAYILLSNRPASTAKQYTYTVVNEFPHDTNAFTQGLVVDQGVLYEGTGLNGQSTLRRVDLETSEVLQQYALPEEYFGEGITVYGDRIIQLTWQSHIGFVYDKNTFELLRNFTYPTQGWGITHDGTHLIMSDGSATLYFLDPETYERVGQISVSDGGSLVTKLNELEYIKGEIYANVLLEDKIAVINPQTGNVRAWIDLTGIAAMEDTSAGRVLNGIAYNTDEDRLFVTGKMWAHLYEIRLVAK
jgi:glutaminyl-peptide cyclotransferase